MPYRKRLDHASFEKNAEEQNSIFEIIQGIVEIKVLGSWRKRLLKWLDIQHDLFTFRKNSLHIKLPITIDGIWIINLLYLEKITF